MTKLADGMTHTPGPWSVKLSESRHRKGSPLCHQECGDNRRVLTSIELTSVEDAKQWGGETEIHVLTTDHVEDVIAADGTHVVCTGHDYEDSGYVSLADARLIAAAPDLLAALKAIYAADRDTPELFLRAGLAIRKAEQG